VLRQYGFRPDEQEPRFGGVGPDVLFLLGDEPLLIDVTIICTLAASYVVAEAAEPGKTLADAERTKYDQYTEFAEQRGMKFHPMAFSTFGTPGKATLSIIRKCASYTADPPGFVQHLLTAIGIAIQIGNARMVSAAMAKWWTSGVR
jgi:hypothetical protein